MGELIPSELVLWKDHRLESLLVRQAPVWAAGGCWSSDTQRVLAIRETNPSMLDKAVQGVAVELVESLRSMRDVLEL